ncbi:MAG: class I SAM-dependent methyltransferase [Ignavibacteria bacterium]|nr:class I SAM-dependent methyltransferase [Ignavibacteria bacterium]
MADFNPSHYWQDRLSKDIGLHRVGHLAYGKAFNRALYAIRRHVFRTVCERYIQDIDQKTILDCGSGTGFYLNLWLKHSPHALSGLDFTEASVEFCARRFPSIMMYHCDLSDHDSMSVIGDASQDIISVFDVLFHITDDAHYTMALNQLGRIMKDDGILLYSDNLPQSGTKRERHIVHRSMHDVYEALDIAGFDVIERLPMFYLMGYPVDTASSWPGKLWNLLMYPVRKSEIVGMIYAAILYLPELLCISVLAESPTTELLICKRKAR